MLRMTQCVRACYLRNEVEDTRDSPLSRQFCPLLRFQVPVPYSDSTSIPMDRNSFISVSLNRISFHGLRKRPFCREQNGISRWASSICNRAQFEISLRVMGMAKEKVPFIRVLATLQFCLNR
jgi:hypothetical protein